jgi:hypothetical protein
MHEINKYCKKAELALKAGDYAEGAEHALIGIKLAKKKGQEELVDILIGILNTSTTLLISERNLLKYNSDINCSFCGKNEYEAKLIGGVKALICSECTELISDTFKGPSAPLSTHTH